MALDHVPSVDELIEAARNEATEQGVGDIDRAVYARLRELSVELDRHVMALGNSFVRPDVCIC